MISIHFQQDDDGPAAIVPNLEAALWQIAEWLPGEDGRHDGKDTKNTWAKERLQVSDDQRFVTMPGDDEHPKACVWRLDPYTGPALTETVAVKVEDLRAIGWVVYHEDGKDGIASRTFESLDAIIDWLDAESDEGPHGVHPTDGFDVYDILNADGLGIIKARNLVTTKLSPTEACPNRWVKLTSLEREARELNWRKMPHPEICRMLGVSQVQLEGLL